MKYSVIIPVYNAEKTLDRCLRSLISQDYHDAEIILVNDGSTDNSGKICQSYADCYTQIRYIQKENGGVSTARNAGLDAAIGTYILFVDSDDYVSDSYFSDLDSTSPNFDYVIFSLCITDGETNHDRILEAFESIDLHSYYSKLSRLLYRKTINHPWNKRYFRCIIEDNLIRFHTDLSIGEDALFNLQYAMHCSSCCVLAKPLYYVSVENDQSLSRKIRSDIHEQILLCESEMLRTLQASDMDKFHYQQMQHALNFLHLREIYAEAKRMHKQNIRMYKRLKTIKHQCILFSESKAIVPKDRYCQLLLLPIRLRLTLLIDSVGWKLAHRSKW